MFEQLRTWAIAEGFARETQSAVALSGDIFDGAVVIIDIPGLKSAEICFLSVPFSDNLVVNRVE